MKRKISDNHVAIIKKMLSKNYKVASIKDFMQINHGVTIEGVQIHGIKKLESYWDVRPELNDAIGKSYSRRQSTNTDRISDMKCALTLGYSEEEIIKHYDSNEKEMLKIKMCHSPYYSISPEYNEEIEKLRRRNKRTNIDTKTVRAIKKEYVEKDGNVLLSEIGEKHKINKATVSRIVRLKCYKGVNSSYNSKINSINKKKEAKNKEKKRVQAKINRQKFKRDALIQKKKQIVSQEKQINTKIKELKESLPGRTVSATTD